SEALRPPPRFCAGGCSSVSALNVTGVLSMRVTVAATELSARRSAAPLVGLFSVVMSTMRKRKAVTGTPVLLVNLRRIESVPKVDLLAGSDVVSRTRAHALVGSVEVPAHCGSISDALICALRWTGLA